MLIHFNFLLLVLDKHAVNPIKNGITLPFFEEGNMMDDRAKVA